MQVRQGRSRDSKGSDGQSAILAGPQGIGIKIESGETGEGPEGGTGTRKPKTDLPNNE